MRRLMPLCACLCGFAVNGCYSLDAFSGDGRIIRGTEGLTRYEILFPSVELRKAGSHTFSFSGAPGKRFIILLRIPRDQRAAILDDKTRVHATLLDDSGEVYDECHGRLSPAWNLAAGGPAWNVAGGREGPDWIQLIGDRVSGVDAPRRLQSSRRYSLRIEVQPGPAASGAVVPVLWAGGAVPWEN